MLSNSGPVFLGKRLGQAGGHALSDHYACIMTLAIAVAEFRRNP
jgi:hypothetical protein